MCFEAAWCSGAAPGARRSRRARKVEQIIEFLEIEELRDKPVGDLSYGQQKRVELGRALACEPKLLLLDEIVSGMNREEKEDIARFTLDIRDELGITGADDRTRHAGRDGHLRPHLRAGLRPPDRRRHAGRGGGQPGGAGRLPGPGGQRMPDHYQAHWLPRRQARCRRCCAHTRAARPRRWPCARKEHGIWKGATWAQYHDTARHVALGLHALGWCAATAHHRQRRRARVVLGRPGRADDRRAGGGHLPHQPLARTAVHRAPLPGQGGHHRRPGADRQGAGRDGARRRPAAPAAPVLRRHEGPAPLRAGHAGQLRGPAGTGRRTPRATPQARPGWTRRSTRSSPTT
jgi:hypothetical protein